MTERPILFNDAMIRAILAERKWMTRRPVRPQPPKGTLRAVYNPSAFEPDRGWYFAPHGGRAKSPFGVPGDRLYVRECWAVSGQYKDGPRYEYRAAPADGEHFRCVSHWRPSIHMPREASRITLEVLDVRAQRLGDISVDEIWADGIYGEEVAEPVRICFYRQWDSIYAKKGLGSADNPLVFAATFKRI